jgi:hypothetical protein
VTLNSPSFGEVSFAMPPGPSTFQPVWGTPVHDPAGSEWTARISIPVHTPPGAYVLEGICNAGDTPYAAQYPLLDLTISPNA